MALPKREEIEVAILKELSSGKCLSQEIYSRLLKYFNLSSEDLSRTVKSGESVWKKQNKMGKAPSKTSRGG